MLIAMPASTLTQFGYLAVAAGTYLEGEAVLISAGAVSHAGVLSLPLVILAATLGSFAWGQTWFRIGSVSGPLVIARRPAWQARAASAERWISRSGMWVLLLGRFCPGMGTLLPTVVGASGYAWRRFSWVDAVGALIWATSFAAVGFLGAAALQRLLGHALTWPSFVLVVGVLAFFLWLGSELFTAAARRRNLAHGTTLECSRMKTNSKQVIITGDDFGLALPVNEAIEIAYREGVLTTTSLLVGEAAADDAIRRAIRNPGLRVGLHLAVCDGLPDPPGGASRAAHQRTGRIAAPGHCAVRFVFFLVARPTASATGG